VGDGAWDCGIGYDLLVASYSGNDCSIGCNAEEVDVWRKVAVDLCIMLELLYTAKSMYGVKQFYKLGTCQPVRPETKVGIRSKKNINLNM